MVTIAIIVLFFLVIATTWWGGLWGNFITLINFFFASLIASSFYEPLAANLAKRQPDYAALMDFISLWLLFVISFVLLRVLTDNLGAYKLQFDKITELVGRSVLSIWIACLFVSFTTFSFHMAPFHPSDFEANADSAILGVAPDRIWLAFIQSRSRGALSASRASNSLVGAYGPASVHPDDAELKDVRVFDPQASFIDSYQGYRVELKNRNDFKQAGP